MKYLIIYYLILLLIFNINVIKSNDSPVCVTCIEGTGNCTSTMECQEGYYCDSNLLKCTKYPLCNDLKDCSDGLLCDRGICVIRNSYLGDKCQDGVLCEGNLDCLNGICILLVDKNCTSDVECSFEKYCNLTSKKCENKLSGGGNCQSMSQCKNGYICAIQAGETLATQDNPNPIPTYTCKKSFSYSLNDKCDPIMEKSLQTFPYQTICNISDGLVCSPSLNYCKFQTNLIPLNCSTCSQSDSCNCLEYPHISALPVCKPNFQLNSDCISSYLNLISCANNGSFSIYNPSVEFQSKCSEEICDYGDKCVIGNGENHQTCHSKNIKYCVKKIVYLLNNTIITDPPYESSETSYPTNNLSSDEPSNSFKMFPSLLLLFISMLNLMF